MQRADHRQRFWVWGAALALCMAGAAPALAQVTGPISPAAQASADPGARYANQAAMIRAGDMAAFMQEARKRYAAGERIPAVVTPLMVDAIAAGRLAEAKALRASLPADLKPDLAMALAEVFLTAGENDFGRARALLDEAQMPAIARQRAKALVEELAGEHLAAVGLYDQVLAEAPGAPPRDQMARSSMETLSQRLAAWSVAELHFRRAVALQRAGKTKDAEAGFRKSLSYAPNDPESEIALTRLKRGDAPLRKLSARAALGRALAELADSQTIANFVMAGMAGDDEAYTRALPQPALIRQLAVVADPDSGDVVLQIMGDLGQFENTEAIVRVADLVREPSPYRRAAQLSKAEALVQLGQTRDARRVALSAASGSGPLSRSEAAKAASVLQDVGEYAPALKLIDSALAGASGDDRVDMLLSRAFLLEHQGQLDDAIGAIRSAVAVNNRRDARLTLAGVMSEHPPTTKESIGLWRKLAEDTPGDAMVLNGLAWALLHGPAEGWREAHLTALQAVEVNPESAAAVDTLGWSFYLHGDMEGAVRELTRAAELAKDDPIAEIQDHLGDAYWRLDRKEEAREQWRLALRARPEKDRRTTLEAKLVQGLTTPAPERRPLPDAPAGVRERPRPNAADRAI